MFFQITDHCFCNSKFHSLNQAVSRNWFIPMTWGDIPLDQSILEQCYKTSPVRHTPSRTLHTEDDVNNAFHRWSKGVECAVRQCITLQHQQDPIRFPKATLPRKFWGRCQPTQYITHPAPRTAKHDPTGGYDPPVEATTNKARLKARQTRRLASFLRRLQHLQTCRHPEYYHEQTQQEWLAIRRAQGYGRSWERWILSFDCIPFVPCTTPTQEWVAEVFQITKLDADAYARQEAKLRRYHQKHCITFAQAHNNNASTYRIIRGKEQRFLNDFPICHTSPAHLCRAKATKPKLKMSNPFEIPVGATITFGSCSAVVHSCRLPFVELAQVSGPLPSQATLHYKTHAYTVQDMSPAFHKFWAQFWLRDSVEEQCTDAPWQALLYDLDTTVPLQPMLDIKIDSPQCLWDSIHRLKPYKAAGADGWHSEELQMLTRTMVSDLAQLLGNTWSLGFSERLMQARTLLFAKRDHPESISDGRPITILGYLARLSSKMISDQILQQWASTWPPEISGGLPRRSARDLSVIQQLQIEQAKTHHTAWGVGLWTLLRPLILSHAKSSSTFSNYWEFQALSPIFGSCLLRNCPVHFKMASPSVRLRPPLRACPRVIRCPW